MGLCVEHEDVFEKVHNTLFQLLKRINIPTGLRIDHPDGLHDPVAYLHKLQVSTVRCIETEFANNFL